MTDPKKSLLALHENMSRVIFGKKEALTLSLVALLGRGHLLIEDVPGVGKTSLARSIAQSIKGDFKRLQCTPDLLPSDVTGVSVFDPQARAFKFIPGPVFTNVLLADEINRAPPRAQSSLLECMAEQQVTVDGQTRRLANVFMVIATQNPIEFHGTYPLPEAQLDRFFMRIRVGYADADAELKMVASQRHGHPIDGLQPVMGLDELAQLQRAVEEIRVADDVARYALGLVQATRTDPAFALGASPRATLALLRASQALALLKGETYVTPQYVKQMTRYVLAHRVMLRSGASSIEATEAAIAKVVESVAVPV